MIPCKETFPYYLRKGRKHVLLVWVLKRCSFNVIRQFLFFLGNTLCPILLYCWYDSRLLYPIHPAYQWLPADPKKLYQVVGSPYLPLEWRKLIFTVISIIFTLLSQVLLLIWCKKLTNIAWMAKRSYTVLPII